MTRSEPTPDFDRRTFLAVTGSAVVAGCGGFTPNPGIGYGEGLYGRDGYG